MNRKLVAITAALMLSLGLVLEYCKQLLEGEK